METKAPSGVKITPIHILAIVIAIIAAIGVIYVATSSKPVVAVGDTINVSYTGTFTNGTVFDSNVGKQPLEFTVGAGQLIPGFDQGVVGMELGSNKTITIPPAEAYGEVNASLIITVPANALGNETAVVGMGVERTTAGGQQEQGVITAVTPTNITVDFNPPLAGKTLIFQIKILSITKA